MQEIKIGNGVGQLKFDTTREQVLKIIGEPEEKESFSLSELDGDKTESWHYDTLGLSLSFDEENNWLLSSIAISNEDYTLNGEVLIGKTREAAIKLMEQNGWHTIEEDEEVSRDDANASLLHVEEASISLWFEHNILTEVQVSPIFN